MRNNRVDTRKKVVDVIDPLRADVVVLGQDNVAVDRSWGICPRSLPLFSD